VRGALGGDLEFDVVEVTGVRRVIAENLTRVAAVPAVTTFRTVDCTALEGFRAEIDVSPLPVLIAALGRTYPGHPMLNASWQATEIRVFRHLHVGLAVDTPRGLVVPILRNADERGIGDLAREVRRLAESARDGRLGPDDVAGSATIGVSNTGSYGSEAGTPLPTPGCAVTVAFGVIAPRALVVAGAVVARPAATISLTFDHRVLDGASAGRALTHLVALLQSDERLRDLPR
jgi:pyruvate/2-oxoglutarate dehydrogenase complex dihydrolipoamide acyltransferase (E2) component